MLTTVLCRDLLSLYRLILASGGDVGDRFASWLMEARRGCVPFRLLTLLLRLGGRGKCLVSYLEASALVGLAEYYRATDCCARVAFGDVSLCGHVCVAEVFKLTCLIGGCFLTGVSSLPLAIVVGPRVRAEAHGVGLAFARCV